MSSCLGCPAAGCPSPSRSPAACARRSMSSWSGSSASRSSRSSRWGRSVRVEFGWRTGRCCSPLHLVAFELDAVDPRERAELDRRAEQYRDGRPWLDLRGRCAVIVDDGIATGSTIRAACQVARALGAARIVVAVPRRLSAGGRRAARRLRRDPVRRDARTVLRRGRVVSRLLPDVRRRRWSISSALRRRDTRALHAEECRPSRARRGIQVRTGRVAVVAGASPSPSADRHGRLRARERQQPPQPEEPPRRRRLERGWSRHVADRPPERARRNWSDPSSSTSACWPTAWVMPRGGRERCRRCPRRRSDSSERARARPPALRAAAQPDSGISAVVSRGGRPDLAAPLLAAVAAPTLLIVGGCDEAVLDLNRRAQAELRCESRLTVVPGATHLFEEPGSDCELVADLARDWFVAKLAGSPTEEAPLLR